MALSPRCNVHDRWFLHPYFRAIFENPVRQSKVSQIGKIVLHSGMTDEKIEVAMIKTFWIAADGFDQLVSRSFAGSGFLVHLHSLTVTMNQKSSVN
jgi:hypothetical protein